MLKLTHNNFVKAQDYIFSQSDDINRAWFRYNFEDGDADVFINVLAKYQYENGGFGGLFYEFDYQGPCLKSTEVAIRYLLGLKEKPSSSHPVIQNMMEYILERYISGIGNWGDVAEPAVNDGVHCQWTRYRGEAVTSIESEDERIEKYDANEKACFAAFVAMYSELVPDELFQEIMKYPVEYILRYWDKNSPDYNQEIFDDGTPYDIEYFQWVICWNSKSVLWCTALELKKWFGTRRLYWS